MCEPSNTAHESVIPALYPESQESEPLYRTRISHPAKIKNIKCVNLFGNPACRRDGLGPELFREDRIAVRRREQVLQQQKAFAEIPAGKLSRPRIHVDVAANAMQVQGQRINERLAGVGPEGFGAHGRLRTPEGLFEPPAGLVHLAVNVRIQLIPHDPAVAGLDGLGPILTQDSGQKVIKAVMIFRYFLILQREGQNGFPAQAELRRGGDAAMQRLLDGYVLGGSQFGAAALSGLFWAPVPLPRSR